MQEFRLSVDDDEIDDYDQDSNINVDDDLGEYGMDDDEVEEVIVYGDGDRADRSSGPHGGGRCSRARRREEARRLGEETCSPRRKPLRPRKLQPRKLQPRRPPRKKLLPKKLRQRKRRPKRLQPRRLQPKKLQPKKLRQRKLQPRRPPKKFRQRRQPVRLQQRKPRKRARRSSPFPCWISLPLALRARSGCSCETGPADSPN